MALRDMLVDCPVCSLRYDVPDSLFGGQARRLCCSHCQHEWRENPPFGPEAPAWPADVPHAVSAGEATVRLAARESRAEAMSGPARQRPQRRSVSDTLFLALLAVILLVALLCLAHRPIMQVVPGSAAFFAAFGVK